LGALGLCLLGKTVWLTPYYKPSPYRCYHVEFGRYASKGVGINGGNSKNLGAAPWNGVWLTLKNKPIHRMCYYVEFGRSALKGASYIHK